MILNMNGGAGGAALNFKVVGGTSAPSNPTGNTIWVNTSTEISGWDICPEQPPRRSNNKNLIVYPYSEGTKTTNGITYTVNSDGSIGASGTPTATAWFTVCNTEKFIVLEPGTYTLSGCPNNGGASKVKLALRPMYGGSDITDGGTGGVTFTLTVMTAFEVLIGIYTAAGRVSNIVFKPQLEKTSSATSFVKGDATGHVWISVGNSSPGEFNALKKNSIQICPISAKQYVNGAWVNTTAKSYQGGTWVDWWDGMLYSNGNQFTDVTGGWKAVQGDTYGNMPTINGTTMTITRDTGGDVGALYTMNKIDIPSSRTLHVEYSGAGNPVPGGASYVRVGVTSTNTEKSTNATWTAYANTSTSLTGSWSTTSGTLTCDLSSLAGGSYYICLSGANVIYNINKVYMS